MNLKLPVMRSLSLMLVLLTCTMVIAQQEAQIAFSEGVKQLQSENYKQAEELFSTAIREGKTKNGLKMSYIYKAFSLNGQGKYNEAIACFDNAIQIDSLDPSSYIDRALTYSYKKDYPKAAEDLHHVLLLDSLGEKAEAAYYHLGKISMLMFDNESAVANFDKLLMLAPDDAEAFFLRGTAKSNLMDSDGAIADLDKAIELRPDYMEAYANRGVQKINKLPVAERTGKRIDCLEDPCADLLQAKEFGDTSIDDMIFLYCSGCKGRN